ncbi:PREDICTED: LOW QUALITY PROTEIN: uncharacterized protein LOC102105065 [Pseudopodoces humilis]|uniref:LOW QUALITY PROTEIN: uncharacterized protein LOC102105065 n=1 Tax=Pseudopodoces humilis TaxID=181119 RepID=UPI0006B7E161|nr:PREDICTED: LOW QUALITY PROTEIN: uncharacterized protein LOC102105065 [Pseudopodoces humilis]
MAFPESTAFPPALIWGFVLFLALKEPIQSDTIIIAMLGGEANFHCNFSLSMDILQVTWQQRNGTSFQLHGLRLIGSFQKKVLFTRGSKASAVTLQNLTLEADPYYRCVFNVFCHGFFSTETYLNIQISIYCVMRLNNSKRNRQKTQCTQNSCKGDRLLQQDLGERASVSLHTPEDHLSTYQNEAEEKPGIKKSWRHLFSEEGENLNSSFRSELKNGPAGLSIKEHEGGRRGNSR